MKKLLSIICILSSFVASSFANSIFSDRFFEIYANVPLGLSNNAISLEDIFFTGDGHVVFDLENFSNLPSKGLSLDFYTNPSAGLKLDIPKGPVIGLSAGANVSTGILLSKDFFTLLSTGYNSGEELVLKASKFDVDIFGYAQADLGFNGKKSSLVIKPSLFFPILSASPENVSAVLKNTEDGDFTVDADVNLSIYSNATISQDGNFSTNNIMTELKDSLLKTSGFDIGADYTLDIFSFLTVGAGVHIPIVPGKYTKKTSVTWSADYSINLGDKLQEAMASDDDSEDQDSESSGSEDETEDTSEEGDSPSFVFGDSIDLEEYYLVNRPLKITVSADLHPFKDFLSAYGMLGFTAKHAFEPTFTVEDIANNFYVDYLLGARISLIGLLNFDLSTERTDQIYAHKASFGINIRLVEVNAGVSLASSSFLKSFAATGVGAFVNVAVGI
ncbi:MAG: hypothetical protein K5829_15975 [Treponema sp.]|nr:hypothetical protein [Treponema sp.]